MPSKTNMSYYSGKPGVKAPKEKKPKYQPGGPEWTEDDVADIMEGVDEAIANLKQPGETNDLVFVTGTADATDHETAMKTVSGMVRQVYVFPLDYKEREGEKCIQFIEEPIDYNYNTYEKVKPVYIDLLTAKSGMRYYWSDVKVESGNSEDLYQGHVVKSKLEAYFTGGMGPIRTSAKRQDYTGGKQRRTPGVPEIEEKDIRTNAYDPMDRL